MRPGLPQHPEELCGGERQGRGREDVGRDGPLESLQQPRYRAALRRVGAAQLAYAAGQVAESDVPTQSAGLDLVAEAAGGCGNGLRVVALRVDLAWVASDQVGDDVALEHHAAHACPPTAISEAVSYTHLTLPTICSV